jgi:hypothetical protein
MAGRVWGSTIGLEQCRERQKVERMRNGPLNCMYIRKMKVHNREQHPGEEASPAMLLCLAAT